MTDTFSVDMLTETTGKRLAAAMEQSAEATMRVANKMGAYTLPRSWPELQAYIRAGRIGEVCPVGTKLQVDKASGVSATITGAITSATVNAEAFIRAVGSAGTNAYIFIYSKAWKHEDKTVNLVSYGITITGTPAEGDTIIINVQASKIDFTAVAIDYDVPANKEIEHTLALWASDILLYGAFAFCAPQALYAVASDKHPDGIKAGEKCYITLDHGSYINGVEEDGDYYFEAPIDLPVGGKIRHSTMGGLLSDSSGYGKPHVLNGVFIFYNANYDIVANNIPCAEGAEGTSLGVTTARNPIYKTSENLNFTDRNIYGSNNYAHSASKKWLESSASGAASGQVASWWTPSNAFDMPVRSTLPGFLYGLDPAFKDIIQPVRKRTAQGIADNYGYRDTVESIYLPSMTELGYGLNNNFSETPVKTDGTQPAMRAWDAFIGASNADKIKTYNKVAQYYWLRSPFPSVAGHERSVCASGALSYDLTRSAYGVSGGLSIG